MIEKQKPAIGLYVIALLIFLTVSYFLSGLFLFSGLSTVRNQITQESIQSCIIL